MNFEKHTSTHWVGNRLALDFTLFHHVTAHKDAKVEEYPHKDWYPIDYASVLS